MKKRIHIVSFDVPFPADYGGVIDIFLRVKWFSENGWEVILHCFEYKRPKDQELNKFAEVHYYHRPTGINKLFSRLPFIVKTRINEKLKNVLLETDDIVLLEGLHCAHYLNLRPGKFWLRTHNIEHEYYAELAKSAVGAKRLFYSAEAKKLKNYESILSKAIGLLVIAENELEHFKKLNSNAIWLPPLFENKSKFVETKPYILFHGNLSVEENHDAALWICYKILPHIREIPFVFAGKEPSALLKFKIEAAGGQLISNPSNAEMQLLINEAAVHLLWTKQASGVKLKFLNALASSGHLICSPEMVCGSGIREGFHLVKTAEEIVSILPKIILTKFSQDDWTIRVAKTSLAFNKEKLEEIFSINPPSSPCPPTHQ